MSGPSPRIILIAAVARNGIIGSGDKLPWHYAEDLKFFKAQTDGAVVVFGSRTYEGLPQKPLPRRVNVVLAYDAKAKFEGAETAGSLEEVAERHKMAPKIFIAGGASVYKAAIESGLLDEMLITEIKHEHDGDVKFPEWNRLEWSAPEVIGETPDCLFTRYTRAKA